MTQGASRNPRSRNVRPRTSVSEKVKYSFRSGTPVSTEDSVCLAKSGDLSGRWNLGPGRGGQGLGLGSPQVGLTPGSQVAKKIPRNRD